MPQLGVPLTRVLVLDAAKFRHSQLGSEFIPVSKVGVIMSDENGGPRVDRSCDHSQVQA